MEPLRSNSVLCCSPCRCQFSRPKSHPLSLSGGYSDVLHTEVLGMAPVHGLDQYGGRAGSSAVQCLSIFAGPWVQSLAPPPDKHIIGNHGCSCKGEFNRI